MRDADAIITLGEQMKAGIIAEGIPAEKITLAPNSVGGDFLSEPETRSAARVKLGLDPTLNYIGTVSSLVDYEGIDDLIEAFAILAPTFPDLRLLLVGSGTAVPVLQQRAATLGLSGRIIFTGRVPRSMTPLYHQALDIFVVPRKDLAVTRAVTPLKPVEALASARPVVASDLPALREIVQDRSTGLLTPANSPQSLAKSLAELLNNPEYCDQLGAAGRIDVLKNRTWTACAAAMGANYERLGAKI